MNISIKKVKVAFNDEGDFKSIAISYDNPNETTGGFDDLTLVSKEAPHPQLLEDLQALGGILIEIAELPKDWAGLIKVRGLTYSAGKDEHRKVVISATRDSEVGSPLNIASPIRSITSENGENDLSTANAQSFERFDNEVVAYLNGKRAQGTLEI